MKHVAALLVALAAACDASAPSHTSPATLSSPPPDGCVALGEIAVYQAVKIPLARDGAPIATRNAEVVQHRPGLLRVFVRPAADWQARTVTARLTLRTRGQATVLEERQTITHASHDADLSTTFNFALPAAAVGADTRWSVQLADAGTCEPRFPAADEMALGARPAGRLKVRLVPLRYTADGSHRMPDLSDIQLARYRDLLMSLYPVTDVELTVREPLDTDIDLTTRGWSELLDSIRALRGRDKPAADVYYFGLVSPAATMGTYCKGTCVAGLAYRAPAASVTLRVGVGVGFAGSTAAQSLAHELGHQHGVAHAPCGSAAELEKGFPYAEGSIGSWGYDLRTGALYDPAEYRDLMGYCKRSWISDYTYSAFFDRAARVSLPGISAADAPLTQAVRSEEAIGPRQVAIVEAGVSRWGHAWEDAVPENATRLEAVVRDAAGGVVATAPVFRLAMDHEADPMFVVPAARAGWATIALPDAAPLAY